MSEGIPKFEGDPNDSEAVRAWREANEDKLNPEHKFVEGPGGALMENKDLNEEEMEALREREEGNQI